MPKTRRAQPKRGTRTGVETNLPDQDESIEQWIESTRSPVRDDGGKTPSSKSKSPRKKAATPKKPKSPKSQVRMTLPGAEESDIEDSDEEEDRRDSSAKKYSRKLRKNGARSSLTSPSDLSRVSTAPPTPKASRDLPVDDDDEEDEEELEHFPAEDQDDGGSDIENALLTQEDEEDRRASKELTVSKQATAKDTSEKVDLEPRDDDDDDFRHGGGDGADSEEGDPLAPPVAEDSSDEEREMTAAEKEETAKKSDNIDGLESDHEDQYDDHDEGPGYNLVHDPETPHAVREARAKKEKENFEKAKKKRRKSGSDTDTEATDSSKTPKQKRKSKKEKNNKKRSVVFSPQGIPIGNRDYQMIPIGAFVENSPEGESGPRRSKRARVKPLEYWRGEKMQLGPHEEEGDLAEAFGDMPVVKEIQKANPTPYKKKKVPDNGGGGNKKRKATAGKSSVEEEEFDSRKLRKKYKYIDGEDAYLWDDSNEDTGDQKVVSYASRMEGSDLPLSKHRSKSEGNVTGKAAQAFNVQSNDDDNYVGYIMGNLLLPPKGIKDSESVGPCAQTFTVCACQPKALEVAYGDPDSTGNELDPDSAQRFLLGPGDMFRVPPGNSYRLENHSTNTDCLLTWTIIRPKSIPTD